MHLANGKNGKNPEISRMVEVFGKLRQLLKKERHTIGFDLGVSRINAVELKKNSNNLQLISFHSAELPPGTIINGIITDKRLLIKKLEQLVQKNNWQGKQAVTVVRGQMVVIQHLKMPVIPKAELKSAIMFELESYLPFKSEEAVIDFLNLGTIKIEREKECLILIAAIPKEIAFTYYEVFTAVGLDLLAIDIVPLALQRTFYSKEEKMVTAFADIGEETTNFFILANGKVSLTRNINAASTLINQEIIREFRRFLDFWYAQSQNTDIFKFVITGSIEGLDKIVLVLNEQLEIPVEIGKPLVGLLNETNGMGPEYAVAAGLALRGVIK